MNSGMGKKFCYVVSKCNSGLNLCPKIKDICELGYDECYFEFPFYFLYILLCSVVKVELLHFYLPLPQGRIMSLLNSLCHYHKGLT